MSFDDTFLLGYAYAREGNFRESLIYFRRIMAHYAEGRGEDVPAKVLSYYGLVLGLGENRLQEAVTYCTMAIKKEFYHPEYYVNLSRIFQKANRRASAVDVLYKGLKVDGQDKAIHSELLKLGVRQKPVIRFLDREHVVNKYLGLLRSRLISGGGMADPRVRS
ncbi:MAG TPA: tetratricopeptide repeat protein [Nitrospiria bacterium]